MTAQTKALVVAEAACARVAPVWPLQAFVAVNPYLGMADLSLPQAAQRLDSAEQRAAQRSSSSSGLPECAATMFTVLGP